MECNVIFVSGEKCVLEYGTTKEVVINFVMDAMSYVHFKRKFLSYFVCISKGLLFSAIENTEHISWY